MAKTPDKQPELLAREEIARLFAICWHPMHRMLLQTIYATGLRVARLDVNLCPCCKIGCLHVTAVLPGQACLPTPAGVVAQQSRGPP